MNQKFYKYLIYFLLSTNLISVGIICFFTREIGIVRVASEFDTGYDFFYKKKDMHRIFYIDPVAEQNLNQLSNESFNQLVEYCNALREDSYRYKISCGKALNDELTRRISNL